MSQGNESSLRFSLEESIWFQKGQEVAELISISLDPNITIRENDQYVTIEGALQLTGEYKRHEDELAEEEAIPSSPKFIQEVEEREEGICEFSHRFPVDITIPNNRVLSLENIDVEVESFDYSFPERSCMKLTADLTIKGLYGEEQAPAVANQEKEEIEVLYRATPESEAGENVGDFIKKESLGKNNPSSDELLTPFEAEARKREQEETKNESEAKSEEIPIVQVNAPEVHSPPEISLSGFRSEESPTYGGSYSQEDMLEETLEMVDKQDYNNEESPSPDESESSSSSEQMIKKKKKKSKKQGLSLTEFFARKEEEEDVARLKVCIVQNGDTLDLLAERYEVSVQSLLKVNHLEVNQDVYEGQVLYIPATVTQN